MFKPFKRFLRKDLDVTGLKAGVNEKPAIHVGCCISRNLR